MSAPDPLEDCYYFLYSACRRGDKCGYRHCHLAKQNPVLCTEWGAGRVCREDCPFRHSRHHLDKKRTESLCYWESQPQGCTREHCEFKHADPARDRWKTGELKSLEQIRREKQARRAAAEPRLSAPAHGNAPSAPPADALPAKQRLQTEDVSTAAAAAPPPAIAMSSAISIRQDSSSDEAAKAASHAVATTADPPVADASANVAGTADTTKAAPVTDNIETNDLKSSATSLNIQHAKRIRTKEQQETASSSNSSLDDELAELDALLKE